MAPEKETVVLFPFHQSFLYNTVCPETGKLKWSTFGIVVDMNNDITRRCCFTSFSFLITAESFSVFSFSSSHCKMSMHHITWRSKYQPERLLLSPQKPAFPHTTPKHQEKLLILKRLIDLFPLSSIDVCVFIKQRASSCLLLSLHSYECRASNWHISHMMMINK